MVEEGGEDGEEGAGEDVKVDEEVVIFQKKKSRKISYQASSPDEVMHMCY